MANFANYGNLETVLTGYAQKINGITEGHTIEGDGVAVTDRDTLNFKDMSVADDSTNLATNVTPHRLTQAELTDILSPLPSAYVNSSLTVDAYNFSTTEKVIGTWIDGKPLYQKSVDFGALPNKTTKTIPHNIANLDKIIKIDAIADRGNLNAWQQIPIVNDSNVNYQCSMQVEGSNLKCESRSVDFSSFSAIVTLRYTKTTDTAVSTGEKIVGQWIDGKPIFEKTWNNISLVSGTNTISLGNNVSEIISAQGYAYINNGVQFIPIPAASPDANYTIEVWTYDKTQLNIVAGSQRAGYIATITIRYTKV